MDIDTADIRWSDGIRQRTLVNLHCGMKLKIGDGDYEVIPGINLTSTMDALTAEDHLPLPHLYSRRLASLLLVWRGRQRLPREPCQVGPVEIEFRVPAKGAPGLTAGDGCRGFWLPPNTAATRQRSWETRSRPYYPPGMAAATPVVSAALLSVDMI